MFERDEAFISLDRFASPDRWLRSGRSVGAGVFDGLSAREASSHEFDFLWLSSFSISAAYGVPDVGILEAADMLNVAKVAIAATPLPVVADLENGYGEPAKIAYVVSAIARAGAAAVCLEDNGASKRCSLYSGYERQLASVEEHCSRLNSALSAISQAGANCAVIARTEALVAGLGRAEALRRAEAYLEAGAHAVFFQSANDTPGDLIYACGKFGGRVPVFVAPTAFPALAPDAWFGEGVTHFIYANQAIRAAHAAMRHVFDVLASRPAPAELGTQISEVGEISDAVGEAALWGNDAKKKTRR
jgi:phosphoenolpyruvate phosphomutase